MAPSQDIKEPESQTTADLIARARQAPAEHVPVEAARLWAEVRRSDPGLLEAYTAGAEAHRFARQFDEAGALLQAASDRFGDLPIFLRERAWLADARRAWEEAIGLWRAYMARETAQWTAFLSLTRALTALNRHDEADAVLLAQRNAEPNEPMYAILYAEMAQNRGDLAAALPRWQAVPRSFPDLAQGYEGSIRSFRALSRFDEARELLDRAVARFAATPGLLQETAHLAKDSGRRCEALRAWQEMRERYPDRPAGYLEAVEILRDDGQYDEASAIMSAARTQFPNDWLVWLNAGILLEARGDWSAAVSHWQAMGERFPGQESESHRLHQAMLRLIECEPNAVPLAPSATNGRDGEPDLKQLALAFESLGGTGNTGGCEFGTFQRSCGAEPLGLLRWASVSPASLIAALNGRFEGMGEAETTQVYASPEDEPKWEIADLRYRTSMHSFVPVKDVPAAQMVVSARRRMQFLKPKLLDDLKEGSKIFVLKLAERRLTQDEAAALGAAMAAHGPGKLLCVCPAGPGQQLPFVERVRPNVFVGYIDFSRPLEQTERQPAWLALCRTALVQCRE